MGVLEEYENMNRIQNLLKNFYNSLMFNYKGLFSKEISLNYKADSDQPEIYFNCLDKDKFSFINLHKS